MTSSITAKDINLLMHAVSFVLTTYLPSAVTTLWSYRFFSFLADPIHACTHHRMRQPTDRNHCLRTFLLKISSITNLITKEASLTIVQPADRNHWLRTFLFKMKSIFYIQLHKSLWVYLVYKMETNWPSKLHKCLLNWGESIIHAASGIPNHTIVYASILRFQTNHPISATYSWRYYQNFRGFAPSLNVRIYTPPLRGYYTWNMSSTVTHESWDTYKYSVVGHRISTLFYSWARVVAPVVYIVLCAWPDHTRKEGNWVVHSELQCSST